VSKLKNRNLRISNNEIASQETHYKKPRNDEKDLAQAEKSCVK
jgi:hypothetical protein